MTNIGSLSPVELDQHAQQQINEAKDIRERIAVAFGELEQLFALGFAAERGAADDADHAARRRREALDPKAWTQVAPPQRPLSEWIEARPDWRLFVDSRLLRL